MKKFLLLLKLYLANDFNPTRIINRKKNNAKLLSASIFVGILFIVMIAYSGFYTFLIASQLAKHDILWFLFILIFMNATILMFFTSLYKTQAQLFIGRDLDFLFSLPLRPWQIMLSRLFGLYVENLLFSFIIIAPSAVVYYYFGHPSPFLFIFFILSWLLLPLIPMMVSSIISFFINLVTSKSGNKNLFNIILTLLIMLGITGAMSQISKIINFVLTQPISILNSFKIYYPPIGYSVSAIKSESLLDLFVFISLCIIPFALFAILLSRFYKQSVSRASAVKKSRGGKIVFQQKSVFLALLKKEFTRYFASYIYVLNTAISPIMLFIVAIATIFAGESVLTSITKLQELTHNLPVFVIVLFTIMLSMTVTTSSAISIEGKNFWILKCHPIKTSNIFLAKILLHIIVFAPLSLISISIICITLKMSGIILIFVFLIPLLNIISSAMMGLIINLAFPRLNWLSETTIVKQSMSVILSMAINTVLVAIPITLYAFIKPTSFNIFGIFACIYFLLIILGEAYYLKTKGEKVFEKIS